MADLELEASGVLATTATAIKAARLVVAVTTRKHGPLSVKAIAKETGFSEWQVMTLLESPEYAELVQTTLRSHCGALIGQGLAYIPEILEKGSHDQRLRALGTVVTAYRSLAGEAAGLHSEGHSDKDADELLKKLDGLNRIKKIKVST